MTQKPDSTEHDLDAYFTAELATDQTPSGDLIAAILRDAEALQPALPGLPVALTKRGNRMREFWGALGGWSTAGALAACLVLGVTVGYTPPDGLSDLTDAVLETAGFSMAENDYFTLDDLMVGG